MRRKVILKTLYQMGGNLAYQSMKNLCDCGLCMWEFPAWDPAVYTAVRLYILHFCICFLVMCTVNHNTCLFSLAYSIHFCCLDMITLLCSSCICLWVTTYFLLLWIFNCIHRFYHLFFCAVLGLKFLCPLGLLMLFHPYECIPLWLKVSVDTLCIK